MATPLCKGVFSQFQEFSATDLRYNSPRAATDKKPSVEVRGVIRDERGSDLFLLKKTGQRWWSSFSPAPSNYQGDPRWFAMLVGPKVASFFGFRKISEDQITAPTAMTLNKRIEEINRLLIKNGEEPIEMRFHQAKVKAETDVDFLRAFRKTSLPIARDGHYAVHDISYHALAILLPKTLIDGIQLRIDILSRFRETMNSDSSLTHLEKRLLQKHLAITEAKMVNLIDYATGNIGFVMAMEKTNQKHDDHNDRYQAYDVKPHVIDYLVRDTQKVIRDTPQDIEDLFMSEIGHSYGNVRDVADYISPEVPTKERDIIVKKSKIRLAKFANNFMKKEKSAIQASTEFVATEDVVKSIRARLAAFEKLIVE